MPKNSQKTIESRRDQVWHLMLKGHDPQSIKGDLNIPRATVYRDIEFLTKKSKQYVYDMAKGTHVLMFQRAIDGIGLALSEAWNKFNDPKVPEKQKVSYLRLIKDCNESMIGLATNGGPIEMAIIRLTEKAERLNLEERYSALPQLTDEEQIKNYIDHVGEK